MDTERPEGRSVRRPAPGPFPLRMTPAAVLAVLAVIEYIALAFYLLQEVTK
jgi:hypothetical protein